MLKSHFTPTQDVCQGGNPLNLKVFLATGKCVADPENTYFETTPVDLTKDNALEILSVDHTTICFKNGYRSSDNFIYAIGIPVDWDNSHSDDPKHWVTMQSVRSRFKEVGINVLLYSSKSHMVPKGGKAARPRFHGIVPLSEPLYDADKFVAYCKWCIRILGSDPQVCLKSQQLFGSGDNEEVEGKLYSKALFIDQRLRDTDLYPAEEKTTRKKGKSDQTFHEFINWENHLHDLEAKGWNFFERNGKTYFQTPLGDTGRNKQDGNINSDGIAYIFSMAPPPFENNKAYNICHFFAGILFGGFEKEELSRLAAVYDGVSIGNCGVPEGAYIPEISKWHLSVNRPLINARAIFTTDTFSDENCTPIFRKQKAQFSHWKDNKYSHVDDQVMLGLFGQFMTDFGVTVQYDGEKTRYSEYPASQRKLDEAMALCSGVDGVQVEREMARRMWLADWKPPCDISDIIFTPTQNYNWKTNKFIDISPNWFNFNTLGVNIDLDAPEPTRYLQFLSEVFGNDPEAVQLLEECCGLFLTNCTKFHKMLLMKGPKRSGKGTVERMLIHILGENAVVGPSTTDLANGFFKELLVGKSLAVISDAHFSGKEVQKSIEFFKNLSGNDLQTINPKCKPMFPMRLNTRVLILCNRLVRKPTKGFTYFSKKRNIG